MTVNDLDVGSAYYEQKEGNSSPQKYMDNELKLRQANENRSNSKNKIDKSFKNIVEWYEENSYSTCILRIPFNQISNTKYNGYNKSRLYYL